MNDAELEEHVLRTSYAGFNCTCGAWKIGSWSDPDKAFANHMAAIDAEKGQTP